MFICVCNAIRESELCEAALRNGGDAESVYAAMGKRPDCRQCLEEAEELIFETREMASCHAEAA